MFIFALSVAIMLYQRADENIDNVFYAGNYSNRGDSITSVSGETIRTVKRGEVIMAVYGLKHGDSIHVNNITHKHVFSLNSSGEIQVQSDGGAIRAATESDITSAIYGKYKISMISGSVAGSQIYYSQTSTVDNEIAVYNPHDNPAIPPGELDGGFGGDITIGAENP